MGLYKLIINHEKTYPDFELQNITVDDGTFWKKENYLKVALIGMR